MHCSTRLLMLCCTTLAWSLAACAPPLEGEDESLVMGDASLDQTFSGQLDASAKAWSAHAITLDSPGTLEAVLDWSAPSADLNLFVADASGTSVGRSIGTDRPERLSLELPAGTYRLGVKCKTGKTAYSLVAKVKPKEVEHVATGSVTATRSWATHTFPATVGDSVSVSLEWGTSSADLNVFLYDPSGKLTSGTSGSAARPEQLTVTASTSGTWKVGIKAASGGSTYTLKVRVSAAANGDGGGNTGGDGGVFTPKFPGDVKPGTVLWGASGQFDPWEQHEQYAGCPVSINRKFFAWDGRAKMAPFAADALDHGRLPWVSVKPPGGTAPAGWDALASGSHDAQLDALLTSLDAVGGPVWLTFHHEPENDAPNGQSSYRAMQKRVRSRMTAVGTRNIALAPIYQGWSFDPRSGTDPSSWFEPGVFDFFGVDKYDPTGDGLVDSVWLSIRKFAGDRGLTVGVGEWGTRGTGAQVDEWYQHLVGSHSDGKGARVVGVSAFDSALNSPDGSWELRGTQLDAFRKYMCSPTTAHIGR